MASYNHTNYSQISHSPDNIYYDLSLRNYASQKVDSEVPLRFSDVRDQPIVPNTKDYYLSIIRFQVDTFESLPVLLFQVQDNQPDINLGIYSVTLEYDDGVGGINTTDAEYIQWVPQKVNAPVPEDPNISGNKHTSDYYYCMNFQYMINLINVTLKTAMDKLKVLAPVLNTVDPPFLSWNQDNTATFYARESHFDVDVFPQVRIYFNRPMYSLLSSFPALKFNITNPNNKYYQILMRRFDGSKVVVLPSFGIDALIFSNQEYCTINQWTPVSSVMFVTSTIPIIATQLSTPVVYIDGKPNNLNSTYNNFANIISDVSSNELAYKPELLYLPSAEYRLIDMTNDQPLTQIDVEVHWRDKLGIIRALYLPPNASCSMKLLFRKKAFYHGSSNI
jgi:hypothetical protein